MTYKAHALVNKQVPEFIGTWTTTEHHKLEVLEDLQTFRGLSQEFQRKWNAI